jgi:hypothetical protein
MAEYIGRDAAIEAAKHAWAKGLEPSQYIEALPAADVAPVVHGRWICEWDTDLGITTVICSRCKDAREVRGCYVSTGGEGMYDEDAYCPNCGAKMDGGEE